jgi:type VI secretion system protein VasJ
MDMELISLGKDPITEEQPAGSDVRYDPQFEELQAEIDKLSSPRAAGTTDWHKVRRLAADILAKKSKDLLVGSYLAVALIHTNQLEGLSLGLTILDDLLDGYWDTLFPAKKRMRGRVGAIEWWFEKTVAALDLLPPQAVSGEPAQQLDERLNHIGSLLTSYLDAPPAVSRIQRALKKSTPEIASEQKPETEPSAPPPAPETVAPPQAKTSAAHPIPEPEELTTAKDAQRLLSEGLQRVRKAAAYFRKKNPANPLGYRAARIAAWAKVAVIPPATDGRTQIPPPDKQILSLLVTLAEQGQWETLLLETEQKLSRFIFWLDLNRITAEALAQMGPDYVRAQEAVCQETAFLVRRLRGLERLAFSDGMPFADDNTVQWLVRHGLGGALASPRAQPPSGQLVLSAPENMHMAETVQKAQAFADGGQLAEALACLHAALRKSSAAREVFLWRLAITRLLIDLQQKALIAPYLDQVLSDIAAYRLEEWDPNLALKGFRLIWTGYHVLADQAFAEAAQSALHRIATLDPAGASELASMP